MEGKKINIKYPNQWFMRKVKDTKVIIFANSCNLKKVAINLV